MLHTGFLTQLIQQYNFILKSKGFQHQKEIKEYQLLATQTLQKTSGKQAMIRLQLRRLEQLADDSTDLGENDDWAILTTAAPASYVHKLLELEIAEYAKSGIKIQKDNYVLIV